MKGKNEFKYKECYLKLNEKYFAGLLPKGVIISKSSKLKSKAGICYFNFYSNGLIKPFEICLSEWYLKVYPYDLEGVLLHEMIHMKLKNNLHNLDFLKEVKRFDETFGIKVPIVGKIIV